jgi:membrane associated rhomboid family serine protease
MSQPADDYSTAKVLEQIQASAPEPWYPSQYARDLGLDRDRFDAPLDQLRMAGVIELTEWVSGRGQGYQLVSTESAPTQGYQIDGRLVGEERAPLHTPLGRGYAVLDAVMTKPKYRVMPAFILITVLVYAAEYYVYDQNQNAGMEKVVRQFGAVDGGDLMRGEWWRLPVCCFVTFDIVHLLVTLYVLYGLGKLGEQLYGRWRLVVIWLSTGMIGVLGNLLHKPTQFQMGSLMMFWGVEGALIAWVVLNRHSLPKELVRSWLSNLGGTTIFMLVLLSFLPGSSITGIVSALVAGMVLGGLLNEHRFGKPLLRWSIAAGLCMAPLVGWSVMQTAMQRDGRWQEAEQAANGPARERGNPAELKDFEQQFLKVVEITSRATATEYFDKLQPIWEQLPADRVAKLVDTAQRTAQGQRADVQATLRDLEALPAPQFPMLMEGRQAGLAYLRALAELLEAADERLAAGAKWNEDDVVRWAEITIRVRGAEARWIKILQTPRRRWQKLN